MAVHIVPKLGRRAVAATTQVRLLVWTFICPSATYCNVACATASGHDRTRSTGNWRQHQPKSRHPRDPTDSIVGQSWHGTGYARLRKEADRPRVVMFGTLGLESSSRGSNLPGHFSTQKFCIHCCAVLHASAKHAAPCPQQCGQRFGPRWRHRGMVHGPITTPLTRCRQKLFHADGNCRPCGHGASALTV
jgi:hypothetical protein